jgi:hypothetical protein
MSCQRSSFALSEIGLSLRESNILYIITSETYGQLEIGPGTGSVPVRERAQNKLSCAFKEQL